MRAPACVGPRHVGDVHRLLRLVGAAEDAVARARAVLAVVLRHEARVAELLGTRAQQGVEGVDLFFEDRLHAEALLHALEGGLERLGRELLETVLLAPHPQDGRRRPEGVAEVVDGRAADVAPLQDRDRAVDGLAHARLLEEAWHHLVLALGEVARRPVVSLLEDHHRAALRGELRGRHRAARARADHADVGLLDQVAAALEELLDHGFSLRLDEWALVADEGPGLRLAVVAEKGEVAQRQEGHAAQGEPARHPGVERRVLLRVGHAAEAREAEVEEDRTVLEEPQRERQRPGDLRVELAAERVDRGHAARLAHGRRAGLARVDHALDDLGQDLRLARVEEALSRRLLPRREREARGSAPGP